MKINGVVIFEVFFIVTGILLILYGTYLQIDNYKFFSNAERTEGQITNILCKEPDVNGIIFCDAYIRYIINEETYEHMLPKWNSKMKKGDKINIYYLKNDPLKIQTESGKYMGYIVIVLGIASLLVSLAVILQVKRKSKKDTNLQIIC